MTNLERLQVKARELARSGKFHGCRPIAFELRFGAGYEEAREWLQAAATLVFAFACSLAKVVKLILDSISEPQKRGVKVG